MAFAGMMIVGFILLLLGMLVIAGISMLMIGIVLRVKKHKKSSRILFVISGIMLGMVLVIVLLAVLPKSEKVPTPAGDVDIMQIAIDKGARFDDPLRYDHMVFYSSFDAFFSELNYPEWEKSPEELIVSGETTDEMIQAVAFAIEHGAKLKWEVNHDDEMDNLFDKAANWVALDGVISEKDDAFLKMIAQSDSEMMELYSSTGRK